MKLQNRHGVWKWFMWGNAVISVEKLNESTVQVYCTNGDTKKFEELLNAILVEMSQQASEFEESQNEESN